MPQQPTPQLPDDTRELKRLLLVREAELIEAKLLTHKLRLEIALLKRQKYGTSSERLRELGQLQLLVEELESEQELLQDGLVRAGIERQPRADAGEDAIAARKPLPAHLPREQQRHEPAERCTCAACGGKLRYLGDCEAQGPRAAGCRRCAARDSRLLIPRRILCTATSPRS